MKHSAGGFYTLKRQHNGWVFDPRIKVISLIELDMLIFLDHSLFYETGVFLLCSFILIVGGQYKTSVKYIGIFVIFTGLEHLIRLYMKDGKIEKEYTMRELDSMSVAEGMETGIRPVSLYDFFSYYKRAERK